MDRELNKLNTVTARRRHAVLNFIHVTQIFKYRCRRHVLYTKYAHVRFVSDLGNTDRTFGGFTSIGWAGFSPRQLPL